MGNNECREVYRLGQDVGMIPVPSMDGTFMGYLSPNSSTQLSSHYMDVHHSLSPEQSDAFNHSLQVTLGESGKVTQGGVGVVALALSFLFDVLAQQVKNQTHSTHFIHQIFKESNNDTSSEVGTVISDYLKLVPLIANDPQRMKEETEHYQQKLNHSLAGHFQMIVKLQNISWTEMRIFLHGLAFNQHMMVHQVRMGADIPEERFSPKDFTQYSQQDHPPVQLVEIMNTADRLRSISPEKQFLLTRCSALHQNLLVEFLLDILSMIDKFFKDFRWNAALLLHQNEDFFY